MKKLITFWLMFFCAPAWANWEPFFQLDAGGVIYYDPTTIRGTNIKRVWTRAEVSRVDITAKSQRTLKEFDCEKGTFRNLELHSFTEPNLQGFSKRTKPEGLWEYPAPQTSANKLFEIICGKKP
jgi:hypothetical protein